MKKILLSLMLAGFTLAAGAQNKTNEAPYSVKPLAGEAVKMVEVQTSGGSISVTGGAASVARIEMYVHRNNSRDGELSKEEIRQRLEADYDINVSVSNGTVIAKARPKRNNMDWKRALNISFRVFTPVAVSSNLTTSGGSISLANLSGSQQFTTSGGSLHIDKLSGKTRGTTSGGSIQVTASKDDIDLSTSGGSIEATDCSGDLHLTTSGGSLRLENLTGRIDASTSGGSVDGDAIEGDLKAHTSGGNVRLSGLACNVDASTSGGHMDVAIKTLRQTVNIKNSGGNIDLQLPKGAGIDLDLQGRNVTNTQLDAFSGRVDGDEIRGTLNGGGAQVSARAGSGRLRVSFK